MVVYEPPKTLVMNMARVKVLKIEIRIPIQLEALLLDKEEVVEVGMEDTPYSINVIHQSGPHMAERVVPHTFLLKIHINRKDIWMVSKISFQHCISEMV